jgi:hypothetical protein
MALNSRIKKLKSYLEQQVEIRSFAEQQVDTAKVQLEDLKKIKQNLVKGLIKK